MQPGFEHEIENITVCVAANTMDKDLLETIIASLLYEDEFPEALKLDIIAAYTSFNRTLGIQ